MSAIFSFQSQLVSIMDALSKTAVLEISKMVEIESKMLKIEITRGRNEIASLTEKLKLMENLLWIAQGGHRQDVASRSITTGVRDGSDTNCHGMFDPERVPAVKREGSSENTFSPTQTNILQQGEDFSSNEPMNTVRDQPELILIKNEPEEVASGENGTDKERTNGKAIEEVCEIQRSTNQQQHLDVTADKQPVSTESIVTLSSQMSPVESGAEEMHWIPPSHPEYRSAHPSPSPAHQRLPAGKNVCQNASTPCVAKNSKIHSLRNLSTKKFVCLQCGKSFRCFSQLVIHQRSHTGEKPYKCTLCGKQYAQKGHLYTHQRTHTGEKPYRCPVCGKGFIQKCTLDMHQRTHTGEKPFVCMKCGKSFTKNCNLKKHLAVHLDPSTLSYSI